MPPGKWLLRPTKLSLTIGPPLNFADEPNNRAGWERIAARLEEAVRALARPATTG
jgi:hypothetical protein